MDRAIAGRSPPPPPAAPLAPPAVATTPEPPAEPSVDPLAEPQRGEQINALLAELAELTTVTRESGGLTDAVVTLRAEMHASLAILARAISTAQVQTTHDVKDALARSQAAIAATVDARPERGGPDQLEAISASLAALSQSADTKAAELSAGLHDELAGFAAAWSDALGRVTDRLEELTVVCQEQQVSIASMNEGLEAIFTRL